MTDAERKLTDAYGQASQARSALGAALFHIKVSKDPKEVERFINKALDALEKIT